MFWHQNYSEIDENKYESNATFSFVYESTLLFKLSFSGICLYRRPVTDFKATSESFGPEKDIKIIDLSC
jgi:hypothetical protein